jgi:hypothetical protein
MYKLVVGKVVNFHLFVMVKINLIEFAGKLEAPGKNTTWRRSGAERFYACRTDMALALLEEKRGVSACKLMVFAGRYADIFHPPFCTFRFCNSVTKTPFFVKSCA